MPILDPDLLQTIAEATCTSSDGPTAMGAASVDESGQVDVRAWGKGAANDHQAVSAHTWFRIGSLTKTVIAVAVLSYAAEARLDLDAPINQSLLAGRRCKAAHVLTIRQLLSHTAGLPNAVALAEPAPGTLEERVAMAEPDFRFNYSNLGYALLGRWMDASTGLSRAEWLRRYALETLLVEGLAFVPPPGSPCATGHFLDPHAGCRRRLDFTFADTRLATAGFLWATVGGLAKVLCGLVHPPNDRAAAIVARMVEGQTEVFGPGGLSYGLGLFRMVRRGRRIAFHDGEIGGFRALIELDLDRPAAVGLLTNFSGPRHHPRLLLDSARPAESNIAETSLVRPLPISDLPIERTFAAPGFGILEISNSSDGLIVRHNGRPFLLDGVEPQIYVGRSNGCYLTLAAPATLSTADYVYANGHLARATRLRDRSHRRLDPAWFGRYWNGYWIDIRRRADGDVTVGSNLDGTIQAALVLSERSLATNLGIIIFTRERGHRCLRPLGTNRFRAR